MDDDSAALGPDDLFGFGQSLDASLRPALKAAFKDFDIKKQRGGVGRQIIGPISVLQVLFDIPNRERLLEKVCVHFKHDVTMTFLNILSLLFKNPRRCRSIVFEFTIQTMTASVYRQLLMALLLERGLA